MKSSASAHLAPVLASLLTALLLSACAANPDQLALGLSEADVVAAVGPPSQRVTLADGSSRWLYSRQPAGQEVYLTDFDAQGRLVRRQQMLDEAVYARLAAAIAAGTFTRADVEAQFGPPAEKSKVYSFNGIVWTYRYRQDGFNRLWHVHIDPQDVVRRAYSTDERRGPGNQFFGSF